ncbi:divergent polysaccharide deacetylase family protein [Nitratifractor sp.]
MLVLIIDDVSQKRQLAAIHALPYHITPSIFPPSQMNRYSYRLARGLKHYMIHLPMQSSSAKMNRFTKTMKVTDSNERIAARIQEIRKFFPTAVFVNNHTGSVFTSNYAAMRRAYIELKRNGFIFIDSRTTSHSVVRKITKIYKGPYIARDIFLDNVQKRSAILAQLKKAVRIAKQRGYAIAIGHPHPATLDALKHAKSVLASVQTVYIDEFYRRIYGRIPYH